MKYQSEHEKAARKIIDDYVKEHHLDDENNEDIYNKIKEKSLQDKKKRKIKVIYGESYKSKSVTKKQIKDFLKAAACCIAIAGVAKGLNDYYTVSEYNRVQKIIMSDELSESETEAFLNSQPRIDIKEINEMVEGLDKDNYEINGDRVDGTHNDFRSKDPDAFFVTSDKYLDAMQEHIEDSIEEYKRGK